MTQEKELRNLKSQVEQLLKKSGRQFRQSIAMMGVLVIVTILSMGYAFIQQTSAVKARNEAIANMEEAIRQYKAADSLKQSLEKCKGEVASNPK